MTVILRFSANLVHDHLARQLVGGQTTRLRIGLRACGTEHQGKQGCLTRNPRETAFSEQVEPLATLIADHRFTASQKEWDSPTQER
ncbi:MAG TPA: hypothetical protein VMH85_04220 [Terriglobales bacterium]|nr:hypothetical protein [Terriglobales bacterium]